MPSSIESELQKRWVWVEPWCDADRDSAGRLVEFKRSVDVTHQVSSAILHITADTRYKLWVNGCQAAIGPTRGSDRLWYYDTIDIAPWLIIGRNQIVVEVLRFYPGSRTAYPFARTSLPGLTIFGKIESDLQSPCDISIDTEGWEAQVKPVIFPFGLEEDVFLHIFERPDIETPSPVSIRSLDLSTSTGEMTPWNLEARLTPQPETQAIRLDRVVETRGLDSIKCTQLLEGSPLELPPGDYHIVLEATSHSTAFLQFNYQSSAQSSAKITYAECYENEPTAYPWLRNKGDRRGPGLLLGPHDLISFASGSQYNPFWYRTFRYMLLDIHVGPACLVLDSLSISQTNYPFHPIAAFESAEPEMNSIWEVSLRTLRNCIFDGYSDCPYYEQLQYAEDTRSSGLFHYLLSGDDRLMRQAITGFAISIVPSGLVQARYPSHIPQIIPGFSLFWVLQVCDHYLYFADPIFSRRYIHQIGMVIDFFRNHIDDRGLVANLPHQYWQFVDWTEHWKGSPDHPDGGVPAVGRASNTHSFASMLLAFTLRAVTRLTRRLGLEAVGDDYGKLSELLLDAINQNCYNGQHYLDSTNDQENGPLSQHAQVFAVLTGAATGDTAKRIISDAFSSNKFVKCSYVFSHYAFRAMSNVGLYEALWKSSWEPWRHMLSMNLSTWEEDSVTQRSDCHAWGSVAIYEYTVEVLGLHLLAPGWTEILFTPRTSLVRAVNGRVALGAENAATVKWKWHNEHCEVTLNLDRPVKVWTVGDDEVHVERGLVAEVSFVVTP